MVNLGSMTRVAALAPANIVTPPTDCPKPILARRSDSRSVWNTDQKLTVTPTSEQATNTTRQRAA